MESERKQLNHKALREMKTEACLSGVIYLHNSEGIFHFNAL
jgi:hypothetical protein